ARVQVFDRSGRYYSQTGHLSLEKMYRPNGNTFDLLDFQYISDGYLGTISLYLQGKFLGLLQDTQGKTVKFSTPARLHYDPAGYLYVVDSQAHEVQKIELGYQLLAKLPEDNSEVSRKNCVTCHYSWGNNDDNSKLLDSQHVLPVASLNMCYSCHHGVVIDSRKSIGHKQQHPDIHHRRENDNKNASNKDKDKIAKEFPLSSAQTAKKKELYCGSCHTPHKLKTDINDSLNNEHNNSWMRQSNSSGEICQLCHKSKLDHVQYKKRPTRGVNHPVGIFLKQPDSTKNNKFYAKDKNLHKGLAVDMISAGASLNGRHQMICQSCHKVHGADEQQLTVIKSSDAEICVQCHQRHEAKDIESARKKGVHPVNVKLEEPVKINNMNGNYSPILLV
ncbi:cytochrome c3 family protein, partial [Alteromonas abrolhosensis]|uniref:cytochrome c3 family protein n=1 Tax=Alteromonas abrolhosensis TaxID=1892904 RepID=UPI003BA852E8